jgi:hypothetical protein
VLILIVPANSGFHSFDGALNRYVDLKQGANGPLNVP